MRPAVDARQLRSALEGEGEKIGNVAGRGGVEESLSQTSRISGRASTRRHSNKKTIVKGNDGGQG